MLYQIQGSKYKCSNLDFSLGRALLGFVDRVRLLMCRDTNALVDGNAIVCDVVHGGN